MRDSPPLFFSFDKCPVQKGISNRIRSTSSRSSEMEREEFSPLALSLSLNVDTTMKPIASSILPGTKIHHYRLPNVMEQSRVSLNTVNR